MALPRFYPAVLVSFALCAFPLAAAAAEEPDPLLEPIADSFQNDFVAAWYPRVVDLEHGGFLSSFSADWEPVGAQEKFIVSQARHVWTASQLAMFTGEKRYADIAEHGYEFLRERMLDQEEGGFFSLVDRSGEPLRPGKQAYGNAFAIYGLASYYRATGDREALDLAKQIFRWLDQHAWDEEFGGYVDRLERDGAWRGSKSQLDDPRYGWGVKDYNSTIHILEALTALYQEWRDEHLAKRLQHTLATVRDVIAQDGSYLGHYFQRDWTPISFRDQERDVTLRNSAWDHVSWGHDVETAFLMLEAEHALKGRFSAETLAVAKSLVDHALATGWDTENGGLYDQGYYFEGATEIEILRREKIWWVQAESLNAMLMMSQLFPGDSRYREAFEAQWRYIDAHLIDHARGGWYDAGLDSSPESKRDRKARIWKANYHDGRAYMNVIKMLRGELELTAERRFVRDQR